MQPFMIRLLEGSSLRRRAIRSTSSGGCSCYWLTHAGGVAGTKTFGVDGELIEWVQRQINTGARRIVLPGHLVMNASDIALEEARRLCKLNGVLVEVRA